MAFEVWGSMFSGKQVIIHTGNVALVSNLNLKTSRYKRAMYLLWRLVLQGLLLNMQFAAPISKHITGLHNVKADSFSRQQWDGFRTSFLGVRRLSVTNIPIVSAHDLQLSFQELLGYVLSDNNKKLDDTAMGAFTLFCRSYFGR